MAAQQIIYNGRRDTFEVWSQSEVIGRGTDLEALFERFPHAELRERLEAPPTLSQALAISLTNEALASRLRLCKGRRPKLDRETREAVLEAAALRLEALA